MNQRMPVEVRACPSPWLSGYRPRRHDRPTWAVIKPFVASCAEELCLGRCSKPLPTVRALALIAAWSLEEGLPLVAEVVLDPANVEAFIANCPGADSSRASYRSLLRRIGPQLTKKAPWESPPLAVSARQVAAPYSPDELRRLKAAAAAQPTSGRRRAAEALLALGAGAGLDGRWVARVGPQSVFARERAVMVLVDEPYSRAVPVLASWQAEVLELAETAGAEYLVGGCSANPNRVAALVSMLITPSGCPKLSPSRLRSTWLVSHLAMGTRLPELARAAGLQGVTVLSDLMAYVPRLDDVQAREMLRGQ